MEHNKTQGQIVSEFSLNLFRKLSNNQNLIFSPSSIYIALAMAALGSQNKTLVEFQQILSFSHSQQLASNTSDLIKMMLKTENGMTTKIANKIYLGQPINQEFKDLVNKNFASALEEVNFVDNSEQIRKDINRWILSQTDNKINELLTPGTINALTKIVLVNAVYFKGDWLKQFDQNNTRQMPFYLEQNSAGQTVQVDMMQKQDSFDFYSNETYSYISLPYQGSQYFMEIILPHNFPLHEFEKTLSFQSFQTSRSNKTLTKLKLSLPKFKIEAQNVQSLKDILIQFGLVECFTERADFSQMTGSNVFISDVIHKAIVEVNEQGTEAVAATALIARSRSIKIIPEINCSKPFIFSITHIPSNTIMFLGKVTNPLLN